MPQLYCKKCNYRIFKDRVINRCPYCDSEGTLDTVKTSQDLLDEISFEMEEAKQRKEKR